MEMTSLTFVGENDVVIMKVKFASNHSSLIVKSNGDVMGSNWSDEADVKLALLTPAQMLQVRRIDNLHAIEQLEYLDLKVLKRLSELETWPCASALVRNLVSLVVDPSCLPVEMRALCTQSGLRVAEDVAWQFRKHLGDVEKAQVDDAASVAGSGRKLQRRGRVMKLSLSVPNLSVGAKLNQGEGLSASSVARTLQASTITSTSTRSANSEAAIPVSMRCPRIPCRTIRVGESLGEGFYGRVYKVS
jgi:hypothetical protein